MENSLYIVRNIKGKEEKAKELAGAPTPKVPEVIAALIATD